MISYTKPEDRIKQLKEFSIPEFFILTPKLAIELESFSARCKNWHLLAERINTFITSSRRSYAYGFLDASIFYAIGAVEFSLKAKKCKIEMLKGDDKSAEEELKFHRYSLGKIISNETRLLEMGILELKKDLEMLNELRSGLFHFNYEKLRNSIRYFGLDDFTKLESRGGFAFITAYIDDYLVIQVYAKCINIIEKLFVNKHN